jgi:hypothetical protein
MSSAAEMSRAAAVLRKEPKWASASSREMRLPPYINGGTLTLSRANLTRRKEHHSMHEPTPANRPMRADAQRNYASLLNTARVAVSEHGADIVLEDVARSAGVAIGTLYRHFPNRWYHRMQDEPL